MVKAGGDLWRSSGPTSGYEITIWFNPRCSEVHFFLTKESIFFWFWELFRPVFKKQCYNTFDSKQALAFQEEIAKHPVGVKLGKYCSSEALFAKEQSKCIEIFIDAIHAEMVEIRKTEILKSFLQEGFLVFFLLCSDLGVVN